jgi:hypothetical protein
MDRVARPPRWMRGDGARRVRADHRRRQRSHLGDRRFAEHRIDLGEHQHRRALYGRPETMRWCLRCDRRPSIRLHRERLRSVRRAVCRFCKMHRRHLRGCNLHPRTRRLQRSRCGWMRSRSRNGSDMRKLHDSVRRSGRALLHAVRSVRVQLRLAHALRHVMSTARGQRRQLRHVRPRLSGRSARGRRVRGIDVRNHLRRRLGRLQ